MCSSDLCGDVVLGLNPVDDGVESVATVLKQFDEFRDKWEIPTQICVLAHVTTQIEAAKNMGAPIDLIFQSIAGSQKGNEAFGITADMLQEARDYALTEGKATGPNVMYFETGQGSELSSEAHNGWDQLTMEARCYGFAKRYSPFLVNTVVGFIGPEYLYDSKQVTRAGLEDHFMGKLTGISMGCDACYTNHMKTDQNDIENLATLLVAAGCNYIMGVPETWLLQTLCDTVFSICRFMGRPAFYRHGKDILARLLYPQYNPKVRAYAGQTLQKIAALGKDQSEKSK